MTQIYCDNHKCEFNMEDQCTAATMYYANRICQTYRRSYMDRVMQPAHRPNCKKRGGKYKSDGTRLWK